MLKRIPFSRPFVRDCSRKQLIIFLYAAAHSVVSRTATCRCDAEAIRGLLLQEVIAYKGRCREETRGCGSEAVVLLSDWALQVGPATTVEDGRGVLPAPLIAVVFIAVSETAKEVCHVGGSEAPT